MKERDQLESPPPPPPPAPVSAPADQTHHEIRNLGSPASLPEANIYRAIQPACDYHDKGKSQILIYKLFDLHFNRQALFFFSVAAVSAEEDYDVLPIRRGMIVTILWSLSVCDGDKLFLRY